MSVRLHEIDQLDCFNGHEGKQPDDRLSVLQHYLIQTVEPVGDYQFLSRSLTVLHNFDALLLMVDLCSTLFQILYCLIQNNLQQFAFVDVEYSVLGKSLNDRRSHLP
jgi:hypothetical protein